MKIKKKFDLCFKMTCAHICILKKLPHLCFIMRSLTGVVLNTRTDNNFRTLINQPQRLI